MALHTKVGSPEWSVDRLFLLWLQDFTYWNMDYFIHRLPYLFIYLLWLQDFIYCFTYFYSQIVFFAEIAGYHILLHGVLYSQVAFIIWFIHISTHFLLHLLQYIVLCIYRGLVLAHHYISIHLWSPEHHRMFAAVTICLSFVHFYLKL